jgi:hypothetical protein
MARVSIFFTGNPETFDYLLNKQDKFMLDLNARNVMNLNVSGSQLNLSWYHSVANGRLSLLAAGNVQQNTKQKNIFSSFNGMTYLHHVVSQLQRHRTWRTGSRLPPRDSAKMFDENQNLKSDELLIVELLNAGADIHAFDDEGLTPLRLVAQNQEHSPKDFGGDFIERFFLWFRLLRIAGHDVQRYPEEEAEENPGFLPVGRTEHFVHLTSSHWNATQDVRAYIKQCLANAKDPWRSRGIIRQAMFCFTSRRFSLLWTLKGFILSRCRELGRTPWILGQLRCHEIYQK